MDLPDPNDHSSFLIALFTSDTPVGARSAHIRYAGGLLLTTLNAYAQAPTDESALLESIDSFIDAAAATSLLSFLPAPDEPP